MKSLAVLLVTFLLFALPSMKAQAKTESCGTCSYDQLAEGVEYLGDGLHYVFNPNTGQLRQFQVSGWGRRPITIDAEGITVKEYPPDPDVNQAVMFLKDFSAATSGTMKTAVEVRADQLGVAGLDNASAFDVMTDINLRGRLGDRLVGKLPGLANLDRLADRVIQAGLSRLGMSDKVQVEITVVFKDGSKVVYVDTASVATAQYQAGRSRTHGGQIVPEANTVDNQGKWTGGNVSPGDDLIQFGNYMRRIGADVPPMGGGQCFSEMTCTFTTTKSSNTLLCTAKPCN